MMDAPTRTYTQEELNELLEKSTAKAYVNAHFVREHAGGVPADEKALAAFVEHHLGLVPETPAFDEALSRILKEEIGERDTAPEDGELDSTEVYQVNVIRRGKDGASYLLEHQIKAMLKQAATRLGIFVKTRGSKGDLAEMGTVLAHGESLQDPARPWEIYLRNGQDGPAKTEFRVLNGSVQTPKGKKSVQHHTEAAQEGARFSFVLMWPDAKLTGLNVARMMAAGTKIGLGSCLSLGFGEFEIDSLEVHESPKPKKKEANE